MSHIDQTIIFNDVPKAQLWFKEIRDNATNNNSIHSVNFDGEEYQLQKLSKLSLVNLRLRGVEAAVLPFTNLLYLNLSFNRISELSGVSHLIYLKTLDVSHNRIVELEPLRKMVDLEILRCDYNLIESLEPLSDLNKIKQLWISNNHVKWEELIYLVPLNQLEIMSLSENSLEKKPKIYEFLCSLKPSLKYINGVSKNDLLLLKTSESDEFSIVNNDFFRTLDGRVMMTRARAHVSTPLITSQRLGLGVGLGL
jgi:Leucine-rich repeat (LRR) protein